MLQFIKKFIKISIWVTSVTLVLFIVLLVIIRLPSVQTNLVNRITTSISKKLNYPIQIGYVDLNWFDQIEIKDVLLRDLIGDTLIYSGSIQADFDLMSITRDTIEIETVEFDRLLFAFKLHVGEKRLNFNQLLDAIESLEKDTINGNFSKEFHIEEIVINNSEFRYDDQHELAIVDTLDYNHLHLVNISCTVNEIEFFEDSIRFKVLDLGCVEKKLQLPVKYLTCLATFSNHYMVFDKLFLVFKENKIGDYLKFSFDKIGDMADYNDKVEMTLQLQESVVFLSDICIFAPKFMKIDEVLEISGSYSGSTGNFSLKDIVANSRSGSTIHGDAKIDGLPNLESTFLDLKLSDTRLLSKDVSNYFDKETGIIVNRLGTVNFAGRLIGFSHDFVADGTFHTTLGKITTDLNLKLAKDGSKTYYKGNLKTENFNYGKLLNKDTLNSELSIQGSIEGSGLSFDDVALNLKADIGKIGIQGYNYRNLNINGHLTKNTFLGSFISQDTNFVLSLNGSIGIFPESKKVNLKGTIFHADLGVLKLDNKSSNIAGDFQIQYNGLNFEDITGFVKLNNFRAVRAKQHLRIDSLAVFAEKEDSIRHFSVRSELLDFDLKGNFTYKTFVEDIGELLEEISLYFENDSVTTKEYYAQKKREKTDQYKTEYYLKLKAINNILPLIQKDVFIAAGTILKGSFKQGITTVLNLYGDIDSIQIGKYSFLKNYVDISASKLSGMPDIISIGIISSEKQLSDGKMMTENMNFEASWENMIMNFAGSIHQSGGDNKATINGDLYFKEDNLAITFRGSSFYFFGEQWDLNPANKISIRDNNFIEFENIAFSNSRQQVSIEGILSKNPEDKLVVSLADFELNVLNVLIEEEAQRLYGVANAHLNVSNIYESVRITGDLGIKNLLVGDVVIGDIQGESAYDAFTKMIRVKASIIKGENVALNLSGSLIPSRKENNIAIRATVDKLNLDVFSPFTSGIVHDINGDITADLKISGSMSKPVVSGTGYLKNSNLILTYLNTKYYLNNTILFDKNTILFENAIITDENGSSAFVNGKISHDYFKDYNIDFRADFKNFNVLNTTVKENDLYFGKAYATGDFRIYGKVEDLKIEARARTEKNTYFAIPLSDYESIEKNDFIQFVNTSLDIIQAESKPVDLSGIRMNFDLDITPDAECELIFDRKTGDIIRGNAQGEMKLEIDTKGDFKIFGDLEIVKGTYNFTFQNFINKEFKVVPESGRKISWTGDPYNADINIRTKYEVNASLSALPGMDSSQNVKQVVNILMDLNGKIMHPEIKFDLEFPNLEQTQPQTSRLLISYLNDLHSNEYELNRQIVSLLILRRLAPSNAGSLLGQELSGSVQEFISNQLSSWLSDANPYLDVDMNLGTSFNEQALKDFELKLTATMFGGRMRVIREGDFAQTNPNESKARAIAGDWSVEYNLTKDGKLRLKMYNRSNSSVFYKENNSTTGFGLLHSSNFNKFSDLRWFSKKKHE